MRHLRLPRPTHRRTLTAFLLTAVLVLVAVAAGTVWLSERIAHRNALDSAERAAVRLADALVLPDVQDALRGAPERWEALDRAMANRMSDGSVTRVVVWDAQGMVLYARDPSLGGRYPAPPPELPRAIGGKIISDVDHRPVTLDDGATTSPVLEVFVPLEVDGRRLAVQTYFSYAGIDRQAQVVREALIPLAIGALVVLQLVQIPIAVSLSRRVRRQDTERAGLMARAIEASERERRTIAADVHDGPVQDLAGLSYALAALRSSVPAERQPTLDRLLTAVRSSVQSLRRLMVDIYPPDLSGPGLTAAVSDAATALREAGLVVTVDAVPPQQLAPEVGAVLYRTAKEALANVAKHAGAGRVWLTLEEVEHEGGLAVRLEVADDGVGYPDSGTDRRTEGHLGLRLIRDRIEDLGGTLELGSRLGGGAVMTAVVPTTPRS
jgi:two-component system, NarL family, sensor kinase